MSLSRLRAWLARMPMLVALLAFSSSGCGYTSTYVPPQDGRARALWRENNVVVEHSGAQPSPACWQEVLGLTNTEVVRAPGYQVHRPTEGYWAPRYYGSPIVVVSPGVAPLFPRPPVFVPLLLVSRPGIGLASSIIPVPALRLGGLGGSGGGKGDGYVLVVLAVIALLVLPAVDIGLALAHPESPTRSSQAIDQVNALNDLMRSQGSPCSYDAPAGGAP